MPGLSVASQTTALICLQNDDAKWPGQICTYRLNEAKWTKALYKVQHNVQKCHIIVVVLISNKCFGFVFNRKTGRTRHYKLAVLSWRKRRLVSRKDRQGQRQTMAKFWGGQSRTASLSSSWKTASLCFWATENYVHSPFHFFLLLPFLSNLRSEGLFPIPLLGTQGLEGLCLRGIWKSGLEPQTWQPSW